MLVMWQYRYTLYNTDQHCIGTNYYRYSNQQRFFEYWFISDARQVYIQTMADCDCWLVERLHGELAGLTYPRPHVWRGGGGEVRVTSCRALRSA